MLNNGGKWYQLKIQDTNAGYNGVWFECFLFSLSNKTENKNENVWWKCGNTL